MDGASVRGSENGLSFSVAFICTVFSSRSFPIYCKTAVKLFRRGIGRSDLLDFQTSICLIVVGCSRNEAVFRIDVASMITDRIELLSILLPTCCQLIKSIRGSRNQQVLQLVPEMAI